jgi:hypothetical protein
MAGQKGVLNVGPGELRSQETVYHETVNYEISKGAKNTWTDEGYWKRC